MAKGALAAGFTLVAIILLSGCTAPGEPPSRAPGSAFKATSGEGAIAGHIADAQGLSLIGVAVTIVELDWSAVTDAGGDFAFDSVPAGVYRIDASLLGYQGWQEPVDVRGGFRALLELTLQPLHGDPLPVVFDSVLHEGFLQCSINAMYMDNTCGAALGDSEDHFALDLDTTRPVAQLVLELLWQPTSGVSSQHLQLDLCLPQPEQAALPCAQDSIADDFHASESGVSPVVMRLDADELPLDVTHSFEAWVGAAFLDPPVAQQAFKLHVTACYISVCPAGYTAVGPGEQG